jgi:CheY-like chemotaxis protein
MGQGKERCLMIVEDEALQAYNLIRTVEAAGFSTVGPFFDCRSALELLEDFVPDGALLDVRLGKEETSVRVADALAELDVPFAFLTAYTKDLDLLVKHHSGRPVCFKPCLSQDVARLASGLTNDEADCYQKVC